MGFPSSPDASADEVVAPVVRGRAKRRYPGSPPQPTFGDVLVDSAGHSLETKPAILPQAKRSKVQQSPQSSKKVVQPDPSYDAFASDSDLEFPPLPDKMPKSKTKSATDPASAAAIAGDVVNEIEKVLEKSDDSDSEMDTGDAGENEGSLSPPLAPDPDLEPDRSPAPLRSRASPSLDEPRPQGEPRGDREPRGGCEPHGSPTFASTLKRGPQSTICGDEPRLRPRGGGEPHRSPSSILKKAPKSTIRPLSFSQTVSATHLPDSPLNPLPAPYQLPLVSSSGTKRSLAGQSKSGSEEKRARSDGEGHASDAETAVSAATTHRPEPKKVRIFCEETPEGQISEKVWDLFAAAMADLPFQDLLAGLVSPDQPACLGECSFDHRTSRGVVMMLSEDHLDLVKKYTSRVKVTDPDSGSEVTFYAIGSGTRSSVGTSSHGLIDSP